MKPNEYPITTPSHKNHLSLFSSFKGFVSDSSSGHGTQFCNPHSKLLLAKKFGLFMVSIWPPTGILPVSLLLLTSKTDNCCSFASDCGIKPYTLLCDKSKLSRIFKSSRLIGTFPWRMLCEMLRSFTPFNLPNDAGISPKSWFIDKSNKE